jgi:hypothetical protein
MASSDVLKITRGDNFPITVQLSRDGTWTLSGSTVEMSLKFSDDVVHTFTGININDTEKTVDFVPTADAVNTVRNGDFDVQVDDGAYVVTHIVGRVEITEDVTP